MLVMKHQNLKGSYQQHVSLKPDKLHLVYTNNYLYIYCIYTVYVLFCWYVSAL